LREAAIRRRGWMTGREDDETRRRSPKAAGDVAAGNATSQPKRPLT
jgi:hypothetical protein